MCKNFTQNKMQTKNNNYLLRQHVEYHLANCKEPRKVAVNITTFFQTLVSCTIIGDFPKSQQHQVL